MMQNIDKFEHIISIDPEKRLGERVGNYRVIRWLGRGAFADVYLGEHIYLKIQSAIKMLYVHLPEKAQKDFLNEACTIARLDHPNIVRILDYGVENGTPFLVMAYAPNGSLRQRFPEGTRLSLEQVVPLVQQMASALDYAHEQRLIHRDVKPENMLIGAHNQVLLSDFGLVLVAQSMASLTAHGMAGTILYMAPEMLEGKVHFASDQYALGIVTYQWLCGECPFTGSSIQVGTQHVVAPPPSLCKKVPGLPPAVEQVVFKALAKDRAQRYEHVLAFANALQDACKDVTSIPATLSLSPSSFPLSERLLEPHEMPTRVQTLLPMGPDTNVLSEKPSSRESVSGVDPLSTAPLDADGYDRDRPFTRRTQRNRSRLQGLLFLCFVIAALGMYAALLPLRARKPDMSVHLTPVVIPPDVPAIKGFPTQPATPTATAQPSIPITNIPTVIATAIPTPTPTPTSYEAESSQNTLAGSAEPISCSACSGGYRICCLGSQPNEPNGTLQFNNVNKSSAGSYTMTIYYTEGDHYTEGYPGSRTGYISVNGGPAIAFTGVATGSWDTVGTVNTTISLSAGNNTIKFFNPQQWAPDIDRIVV